MAGFVFLRRFLMQCRLSLETTPPKRRAQGEAQRSSRIDRSAMSWAEVSNGVRLLGCLHREPDIIPLNTLSMTKTDLLALAHRNAPFQRLLRGGRTTHFGQFHP
jgi:hypothetical protein